MLIITKMQSKLNDLLELFFNSSKQWHFEELSRTVPIGKPQLARWLRVLEKEKIISRVKPRGKMPYYRQNTEHPAYQQRKRLYAWQKLAESGLVTHLAALPQAKVVVVFGSFARADWHQDSDIDIFVYGSDEEFEQGKYELKLKREIQLHTVRQREGLQKVEGLLPYVFSGNFIKGSVQDLGVEIHAKS